MDFLGLVIPTRIGEYLIATVVIVLAPGPSVLFVIARAISWGRRVAVLTVLGNASGALTLSVVVALGFGHCSRVQIFSMPQCNGAAVYTCST